jgi:hypothetical protein
MRAEPKRNSRFLSQRLAAFIVEFDSAGGEEFEALEARGIKEKAIRTATSSLEGFADEVSNRLRKAFEETGGFWEALVDEFYCHEVVANIPGMVDRFLRVSPVLAGVIPSVEVGTYLREATRCFIYGFFQGSTALCRSALESGLDEHLKRKLGTAPHQTLDDKIATAARLKLISPQAADLGQTVRKTANKALHGALVKANLAFDTLVQTRGFVKELYGTSTGSAR